MTLKLIDKNAPIPDEPKQEIPDDALDAIVHYLRETELGSVMSEDVEKFTLMIETSEGLKIAGNTKDYYELLGTLEDAKLALVLQRLDERIYGDN